jgi:hypothetical protein
MWVMKEEVEQSMNEMSNKEMSVGFSTYARGIKRRTEFVKEEFKMIQN